MKEVDVGFSSNLEMKERAMTSKFLLLLLLKMKRIPENERNDNR